MRRSFLVILGLAAVTVTEAQANCYATVNGRQMTPQECEIGRQVYGVYPRGHYLRDNQGNWVNLHNWSERGNVYDDAQRRRTRNGGPHWGDSPGCVRTEFGSVC